MKFGIQWVLREQSMLKCFFCLLFSVLPNFYQFCVSMIWEKQKMFSSSCREYREEKWGKERNITHILWIISLLARSFGQQLKPVLCLYQDLEMWSFALALAIEILQEFLIHTCITWSKLIQALTITPSKQSCHQLRQQTTGAQPSSEDGIEQFSFECGKVIGFALIGAVFNQGSKVITYCNYFGFGLTTVWSWPSNQTGM